jgi:hypothetical protein
VTVTSVFSCARPVDCRAGLKPVDPTAFACALRDHLNSTHIAAFTTSLSQRHPSWKEPRRAGGKVGPSVNAAIDNRFFWNQSEQLCLIALIRRHLYFSTSDPFDKCHRCFTFPLVFRCHMTVPLLPGTNCSGAKKGSGAHLCLSSLSRPHLSLSNLQLKPLHCLMALLHECLETITGLMSPKLPRA